MKRAPGKAEKLVVQFEAAFEDYCDLGSIPLFASGPDAAEEQWAIDRERRRIKTAYTRTRNRLLKALETPCSR